MKKITFFFAFILILLAGCNKSDINELNNKYDQLSIEQKRQAELLQNYETLLKALQNKLTISNWEQTSNGYKIIFSDNSKIELTNGHTPVFSKGDNGNWFIDGKDSGIKAEGKDGLDGKDGKDGQDGKNGTTPEITIVGGYWYINGTNTNVKAEGTNGSDGTNGTNGTNGQSAPSITEIIIQDGDMVFKFSDNSQITVPMAQNTNADYSKGFFIVNEGWFGHDGGSVNFYRYSTNQLDTGLVALANSGKTLGTTTQYGAIYNQRMYLISKQGALVVVDAKTMKETDRINNFNTVAKDGRAFCGVNADLGLVSTADGIYKLNLNPLSVGAKIDGISGQVGEMLQYRQYVFAVASGKIYAINTTTWAVDKTFTNGKGGLVVSKDGMIWSANGNVLVQINPYTLDMQTINMPAGVSVSYNAFAWTASSLCASKQENALYFFSGLKIYKYVIGDITSLSSPLFTVPTGRMIYGGGINVNPKNNQVVVTTIDGYGTSSAKNNLYFYDGTTGSLKKTLTFDYYWFPAMILFAE